jgi:hypothetical protein
MLQVNSQGHFQYASTSWFARALGLLHASGVEGVAVDVWVSSGWQGHTMPHSLLVPNRIIVLHDSLFMYQVRYVTYVRNAILTEAALLLWALQTM